MKEGWKIVTLGEAFKTSTGTTPSKKDPKNYGAFIPLVKPPDLQDYPINSSRDSLSKQGMDSARIAPKGSVLVTCIGNLGRTALLRVDAAFNQQINAIHPAECCEPAFMFYQTQSPSFRQQLERLSSAVYRASVLKEAFGGRLTGSENGFEAVSLKSIATEIRNGLSTKPNGREEDVRILRISAARPMRLNLDDYRFIKEADAKLEKSKLEKGDLLFTRYNGSRNYVGVGGMFNSEELYTYPDKLIRVRLNQEVALPRFVMYAVNSGESRHFLEGRIRTTAGQSGISGSDLKQTPIPLPSLPEQHQIVAEIESRLRMGVLRRAFLGELV